jgi:hypothetical protein
VSFIPINLTAAGDLGNSASNEDEYSVNPGDGISSEENYNEPPIESTEPSHIDTNVNPPSLYNLYDSAGSSIGSIGAIIPTFVVVIGAVFANL